MVLRQALIRIFGGIRKRQAIDFKGVVGAIGFEPTASWSRSSVPKILKAFPGVAYAKKKASFSLLAVPKLYLDFGIEL
jgi:hypothetical protein